MSLLERGAEREATTAEGKTAADIAAEQGHAELAALFEPEARA